MEGHKTDKNKNKITVEIFKYIFTFLEPLEINCKMEALLAEVERKRKQVESCEVTSKKKYFRRGELAAKQAEDYKKKEEERLKKKGLLKEQDKEEADRREYIR